jgi:periplasmic copper chaperone A
VSKALPGRCKAAPRFGQVIVALMLTGIGGAGLAFAHHYRFGNLEIQHPAILATLPGANCSCAHLRIVNHGAEPDYFLGASFAEASNAHLLHVNSGPEGVSMPDRVEIPAGTALDIMRPRWCLFLSGISRSLEADVGTVEATLTFARQGRVSVEFLIDAAP